LDLHPVSLGGWRLDARVSRPLRTVRGQRAELVVDVYNLANLLNSDWGRQYLLPGGISAPNASPPRRSLDRSLAALTTENASR
jgi:hypothetical protein